MPPEGAARSAITHEPTEVEREDAAQDETPIDVTEIVREIEAEVSRRREAGEYPEELLRALQTEFAIPVADELPELLANVGIHHPLTANRRPHRVILAVKGIIRRMVAWYLDPIVADQNRFNIALLREVRLMERRLERVETPWPDPSRMRRPTLGTFPNEVDAARQEVLLPLLLTAPPSPILVLGAAGHLTAALNEQGRHAISGASALQEVGSGSRSRARDPIETLERTPPQSLGGIVMARFLPCLSAEELLRIMPLARKALRPGGLVAVDFPNQRHPLAPPDPSGVEPSMQRWLSTETLQLLWEMAGLSHLRDVGFAETAGVPAWRIVLAERPRVPTAPTAG